MPMKAGTVRTHGSAGANRTREYRAWISLRARCYIKSNSRYSSHGARGVVVCDRWRDSFENFLADMGKCPSTSHSLDRIDNDGNYEPENCRWATHEEQANNRRNSRLVTHDGMTLSLAQWSRLTGINHRTLGQRLKRHSFAVAISAPVTVRGRRISHTPSLQLLPAAGPCPFPATPSPVP